MATNIVVPQMGESVLEGTIVEWKVAEGDKVEKDQPLVELATDKVNVEIPSEISGIVGKLMAQPGETVRVGAIVAVILAAGESMDTAEITSAVPDAKVAAASAGPAGAPITMGSPTISTTATLAPPSTSPSAPPSNGRPATGARGAGKMAPAVRKLVREYGVDAGELIPTGPKGRLTKDDVLEFVSGRSKVASVTSVAPTAPTAAIPTAQFTPLAPGERERREPLSGSRKAIAEHMVRSVHTSPHVTTFEDCDFTDLVTFREKNKAELKKRFGVNVTFMPFIIKAVCVGLKDFPIINASITETEVIYKNYYNIGIAVGRDVGLIVPVVHNADQKSIVQLASEIATLSANANNNKLNPQDLMDGTFTLTNAGMFGATASTPIISQPQVCILGVHNIRKMPWVIDDAITIRRIMTFGLSFDHRLVDGHIAVQFLHRVIGLLEEPAHMLVYA